MTNQMTKNLTLETQNYGILQIFQEIIHLNQRIDLKIFNINRDFVLKKMIHRIYLNL